MAGICTVIASLTSVVVNVPLALVAHARPLMQWLIWAVGILLVVGAVGVVAQGAGGGVAHRLVHAWVSRQGMEGRIRHRSGGGDVPHTILFDLDETLIDRTQSIMHYAGRLQRDFTDDLGPITPSTIATTILAADERGYRPRDALFADLVQRL